MVTTKSFQEKTSADDKSIGFEYQYYYFLYRLLQLKNNETIGLEVKDDVHLEGSDGTLVLMQLKHSVRTTGAEKAINLRERDIDLWKTLFNWINIIKDKEEGRENITKQIPFIEKTKFLLVSNKLENDKNLFLKNVKSLKDKKIDIDKFKEYLNSLISSTTQSDANEKLISYMKTLEAQESTLLEKFLKKVSFELDQDDLIEKIKNIIKTEKFIDESRVEDVLHSLDSSLRIDNYINVKNKNKITISCSEFYKKYRMCFEYSRTKRLPIRRWKNVLPDKIDEQTFIRQIVDIDEIREENDEEIVSLTMEKMLMENNIREWLQNGELTPDQEKTFHNNCKLKWKNLFNLIHLESKEILGDSTISDEEKENRIKHNALKCLYKIRLLDLTIDSIILDSDLSNGEFYSLSDIPEIGWNLGWEEKYKQND